MPRPRSAVALLGVGLLLAACGGGSPVATPSASSTPVASAPASTPPALSLRDVAVTPVVRAEAGIAAAFDAAAAAEMVEEVPTGLDLVHEALICVYLGERPSGTWTLTLQSASIVDGELRIVARERSSGGPAVASYPADCALLNRDALPAGQLAVRADDTSTDEFITDGTLTVPSAPGAP